MSLHKFIDNPPEERVETVKFQGEEFVLRGSPNAKYWSNAFVIDKSEKEKFAHHWTTSLGLHDPIESKLVSDIKLIAMTLQKDGEDLESRYDEMDIAKLSVTNAKLFMSLYTAALKVTGVADSPEVIEQVAGKSLQEEKGTVEI